MDRCRHFNQEQYDNLVICFIVCSTGLNWISYSGIYYLTVKMCFSNIIVINMTNDVGELRQPNKGVDRDIEVHKRQLCTYSQYDLFAIRETLLKNRNWKQINYDTCKIISRLRLNRRGCRAGKNRLKSRPNHDNLTPVVVRRANEQKIDIANKLKLSTVNIQSIKSKDDDLLGYLLESKTDVCVVTEMWLSDNNEEDGAWVSCTHS